MLSNAARRTRTWPAVLILAALLCAVGIAYAVMSVEEAQAHECGHWEYHQNHEVNGTHVKGNHDHTLSFTNDHGHDHDERDVIYTNYGSGSFYIWAAGQWHFHCLITKVGGM